MSTLLNNLVNPPSNCWWRFHNWCDPTIIQYIQTGDASLISKMPKLEDIFSTSEFLPPVAIWEESERRMLHLWKELGFQMVFKQLLWDHGHYGNPDWTGFARIVDWLIKIGFSHDQIVLFAVGCRPEFADGSTTPAGDLLLAASNAVFPKILQSDDFGGREAAFFAERQPARLLAATSAAVGSRHWAANLTYLLIANAPIFHQFVRDQSSKCDFGNVHSALAFLLRYEVPRYTAYVTERALQAFEKATAKESYLQNCAIHLLLDCGDQRALSLIVPWMSASGDDKLSDYGTGREDVLSRLAGKPIDHVQGYSSNSPIWLSPLQSHFPDYFRQAAESALKDKCLRFVLFTLGLLKEKGFDCSHDEVKSALVRLLAYDLTRLDAISMARAFNIQLMQKDLWPLMQHKSRPVRGAAARSLAGLGFEQAKGNGLILLEHKKADIRQASVVLFATIGGEEATRVLKARLDIEENDDVRDDILLALERNVGGAVFTTEELQTRIAKTLAKVKGPPAAWVDAGGIKLQRTDGSQLSADEVLYLLHRQSRCKDMRADLEAKPMFASLDRAACSDSALALWQAFMGSGQNAEDRWALAFVALTGDDRLVPPVHRAILDWADKSRGKLAEYGAQALALLGTEAALMVVESLSVRFRSKNKNIGKAAADAFAAAAEARGVSIEELGDLVVPWLGFEAGKPRIVQAGKAEIEVRIDSDFKLTFRDTASGKKLGKLPPAASAETQAEFKALAGTVKEALKAQLLRIETLLVRQFRWPVACWRELYLAHPLLRPFTQRLVWSWHGDDGVIGHTFRALDDGSLTDVNDDTVELPDHGVISLVHPLELEDAQRSAWVQHLVDYKIDPPFPQLNRPVVRVKEDERAVKFGKQVEGTDVNAMSFRGRAKKLGWTRGSVCDAGGVPSYRKVYSGAGVEAFLDLEGMYVGIGMEETIKLGRVCFVRAGSVQIGSYIYDDPSNENDARLIAFGEVPPVPFSETMGDLIKISGKTVDEAAATE